MKKIITVLGARPQFIKASAVSRAMSQSGCFSEVVIHTGQHFDANMSDVFFSELDMEVPSYNLGIHGGAHGAMTGQMLAGVEKILFQEQPDAVLVYGDTNSTLAGALAAAKLHVPVAHVESGLRSFNMRMPEEINRVLTDRISTWLFTPTDVAVRNLLAEGVPARNIIAVGDVMYDVALQLSGRIGSERELLLRLGLQPRNYVLVTVHRAENTDDIQRLKIIVSAITQVAAELQVVWPVHPRARAILQSNDLCEGLIDAGVHLIDPVGYQEMVQLEKNASLIATDSGGVQKEAFFYQVPCVTFRDETEWMELVDSGWNRLAPPVETNNLCHTIRDAIGTTGNDVALYGDGYAANKIVGRLAEDIA